MSDIEWTDETWNPVTGCTKVSPGCAHCYAETFAERFRGVPGHPFEQGFDLKLWPERLTKPFSWKKPRKVFVNSMSDLFHEDVPFEFIDRVFAVMALTPQHTYQVLTKRPERMREYFAEGLQSRTGQRIDYPMGLIEWWTEAISRSRSQLVEETIWNLTIPLPNVWLGTSTENQHWVDIRVPELLACPAAVRFLSCEPLLGPLDLSGLLVQSCHHGGSDVSLNDEERLQGGQERQHVSPSPDSPGSDRLPPAPGGTGVIPANMAPHRGSEPIDHLGVGAVDGDTPRVTTPGASAHIDVPFTIEETGDVAEGSRFRRHGDGLPAEGWALPPDRRASGLESPADGGLRSTEFNRERGQRRASLVPRGDRSNGQTNCPHDHNCISWVIVGGESGSKARPFDVGWARSIVSQCRAAGVPVFVKQLGAKPVSLMEQDDDFPRHGWARNQALKLKSRKGGDMAEWPEDLQVREWPV